MNLQIWNDSIIFHVEWILLHVHVLKEILVSHNNLATRHKVYSLVLVGQLLVL